MTDELPPYSFWDSSVHSLFLLSMIYYLPSYCIFIPKLTPASQCACSLAAAPANGEAWLRWDPAFHEHPIAPTDGTATSEPASAPQP